MCDARRHLDALGLLLTEALLDDDEGVGREDDEVCTAR